MKQVVVFDVCGTLFSSNTTYDFYKFLFKKYPYRNVLFKIFQSVPLKVIWKVLHVFGYSYVARNVLLSFLKDLEVKYVMKQVEVFYDTYLDSRRIEVVHKKLQDARTKGIEIILLSASIEPIIEVIADILKVDGFYCTVLAKADGKYTGRVANDIEGKKLQKLQRYYTINADDAEFFFYTDNKEDLPLLKKVKHPVVVVNKQTDEAYWRRNLPGATYIYNYE